MNLPDFLDVGKIAQMAALVLMIVQYIKPAIPEKLIPVASMLVGIGISFLFAYNVSPTGFNYVMIITYGVFSAIAADTGYSFLSSSKSSIFSLPSKAQINKTEEVTK